MRVFEFLFLAGFALADDVDLHDVDKQAVRNYQKNQVTSLRYEYLEEDETKGKGVVRSQVITLFGKPYERQIGKNGTPLSPDAEQHEEQKLEKTQFTRQNELKGQRDIRVRKWKEQTRFLEEAPDAF